jgi:hypothetical protein
LWGHRCNYLSCRSSTCCHRYIRNSLNQ